MMRFETFLRTSMAEGTDRDSVAALARALDIDASDHGVFQMGEQTEYLYKLFEEELWELVVDAAVRNEHSGSVLEAAMRYAGETLERGKVLSPDVNARHFHAVVVWLAAEGWAADYLRHMDDGPEYDAD